MIKEDLNKCKYELNSYDAMKHTLKYGYSQHQTIEFLKCILLYPAASSVIRPVDLHSPLLKETTVQPPELVFAPTIIVNSLESVSRTRE